MAKVLITGGAGFIGMEIAKECVEAGLEVRVFDLARTDIPGVSESIVGSILDPYDLSQALKGCDYVIHAAAALGVARTESRRLECLSINIQGTVNVLDAAVKRKVKKVLFTSSSEVYGDAHKKPVDEQDALNPKSNYAITKLAGEEYLRAYAESYDLHYAIVRLFSVYGERQVKEFVIPKFVSCVVDENPMLIYGDGQQVRSFCHVEDAARGAVLTLLNPTSDGQTYNIGNSQEPITMLDLAKTINACSPKKSNIKHIEFQDSDRDSSREIYFRIPSIEKAKLALGYEPVVSLKDGITRTLKSHTHLAASLSSVS